MNVDDFKGVVRKFVKVLDRADGEDGEHESAVELLQNTNNSNVCANTIDQQQEERKTSS